MPTKFFDNIGNFIIDIYLMFISLYTTPLNHISYVYCIGTVYGLIL